MNTLLDNVQPKPRVRIRGVNFIPVYSDDGNAEIMTGFTENHPDARLNNGRAVYTSEVIRKSESEVETLNTIYEIVKDEGAPISRGAGTASVWIPI